MSITELVDPQLKNINKSDTALAVFLNKGTVICSFCDVVHQQVLSVSRFDLSENSLEKSVEQGLQILKQKYFFSSLPGKIKLAVDLGNSFLIPKELYDPGMDRDYLKFTLGENGDAACDEIEEFSAVNVYSIRPEINDFIKETEVETSCFHISTPLIKHMLKEHKNSSSNILYSFFSNNRLHVVAMENRKIIFYNTFPAATGEDMAYYLLAACEELAFHPENVKVLLSGDIKFETEQYQTITRFIKDVQFAGRPKALKYSKKIDAVAHHYYAPIFAIHLCA